jgi:translation elongation factor EF-1alpha
MGREEIGKVFNYYSKAEVAAIALTAGELHVGDTIMIEGATSTITMEVESMQIEHAQVQAANAGQSIGVKVPERVRPGDKVYKIEPTP